MLVFSMTFIGLSSHVLDRRIELVYAYIENAINMYFRNLQDNPKSAFPEDMPISEKIGKLVAEFAFFERFYYMAMDPSRSRLLIEIWVRKSNMKNQSVFVWNDCTVYGDYIGNEYHYRAPDAEHLQDMKYVYQVTDD
ncbi:unnamed protein product [Sphagnum balticum]